MGLIDFRHGDGTPYNHLDHINSACTQIRNGSRRMYKIMEQEHSFSFDLIWNNPEVSPQEIFDVYGVDAAALFLFSSQIQTMLSGANPAYIPLVPPYEYTINQDGTVTVGNPINPLG